MRNNIHLVAPIPAGAILHVINKRVEELLLYVSKADFRLVPMRSVLAGRALPDRLTVKKRVSLGEI